MYSLSPMGTGTNMLMTMQSAAKSTKSCSCETVSEVADALSNGALRGKEVTRALYFHRFSEDFLRHSRAKKS